jgi:hypothetical protein
MVYVLNKFGKPLMPCGARKARLLLSRKKAKVINRTPFTIKLLYGSTGYKQEIIAGLDTGSVTIGCAATANGKVVYQSEVTLRNDISKKMKERASFRRTRRGRKIRYRKARFNNRCASHRKGSLPPSIKSKINSHLREVKFIESILPITQWNFELASFDIHKITNPDISGKDYQNGLQKDFYNVKSYILHRDNYKCQSSQKVNHSKKLQVHHIQFRSNGGSDAPSNLITLCETCHENLHDSKFALKAKKSKTKHATEMGIINSKLSNCSVKHQITYGYFSISNLDNNIIHASEKVTNCIRFSARTTTQIEEVNLDKLILRRKKKGATNEKKQS